MRGAIARLEREPGGYALYMRRGLIALATLSVAVSLAFFPRTAVHAQLSGPPAGVPQQGLPGPLQDVGIDQKLNAQIPLDLTFTDEKGGRVKLSDYFGQKPVILALVYYECPMLCTQVLNGLDNSLRMMTFDAGNQFNVVTVSFNPRETPSLAAAKKETYLKQYKRPTADQGWSFLTGDEPNIKALADSVGFKFAYDPQTSLYAHASGVMVLTPEGKLSRYFYGIEYPPADLRLAIVEASKNKIGSAVDKVLLFCYHYDPATGKYSVAVLNLVRAGGLATILAMAAFFLYLRRRKGRGPAVSWQLALLPLFPEQASSHAAQVDLLYGFLVVMSVFFSFLIFGLIIFFAVKYRRRTPGQAGSPLPTPLGGRGSLEIGVPPVHARKLEVVWIVVPAMLSLIIFVWGAKVFFNLSSPPDDSEEIYVVAKQWMWKFQHLDGHKEINELHVPVNRNIKMVMTTEDVIHSFFVPAFRVKADVVPGRYSSTWFKATEPGRYHLFCAEYCGTNHSGMGGWVEVMEPAAYEAWLAGGAAEGSLAATGEKLFQQLGCATCHRSDGGGRGPTLNGLIGKPVKMSNGETVIADESYLRECILKPKPVAGYPMIMPTFQGLVTEEQLLQLVSYLKSLSATPDSGGSATAPRQFAKPADSEGTRPAIPDATPTTKPGAAPGPPRPNNKPAATQPAGSGGNKQ